MNAKLIATRIANEGGTKEYRLSDRAAIHAMVDILLDDGAVFRLSGNNGGTNITVQFHSDEHRSSVEVLLDALMKN